MTKEKLNERLNQLASEITDAQQQLNQIVNKNNMLLGKYEEIQRLIKDIELSEDKK